MKERISLRERKKLMSRQKILQTAAVLFKKHSFSEISIADIMKSANLGVGTFYNYFASKEELLLALLKDIAQKVDQCVEDGKKRNLNSLQLLDFASNVMAKLLDENRFVLPLFLSASEHSDKPELLPTRKYTPTFKPIFEQILNQGQLNEEIRTDIPADLIAEMFHSIYQAASFSKLDIPFQKNIQLKVRLLIDGISLTK
ncbi:MAG: TetR/AcrR family transcriptional regulator [Selenomonadaceae bacterium]|nr:TetR/AcrR family transcriptional regulator [Selenomonadaceae bacterium]MBR1858852.1 TetR/AcrR family transcriptional regulator [Selenomonadaceae bacterium]